MTTPLGFTQQMGRSASYQHDIAASGRILHGNRESLQIGFLGRMAAEAVAKRDRLLIVQLQFRLGYVLQPRGLVEQLAIMQFPPER